MYRKTLRFPRSKSNTLRKQERRASKKIRRGFWQNAVPGIRAYEREGALGFSAECASSQSRYGFTVPVQSFEKVLALFASALKQPKFSDSAIRNEFESLKSESASYASSAGGFINAAVDAQVLSHSPWKKDSFLQSALFAKMNTEAARQKLSRIARIWYVPNQSALFVSGPLNAQTVLDTVKKELADWEYAFYAPPDTDRLDAPQTPDAPKISTRKAGGLSSCPKIFPKILTKRSFNTPRLRSVPTTCILPPLGPRRKFCGKSKACSIRRKEKRTFRSARTAPTAA